MKNRRERGSIALTTAFVSFVFVSIGLGLVFASEVYARLSSHKKNTTLLAYAAENGVKRGFENLAEAVDASAPAACTEGQFLQYLSWAQAGGNELAELSLNTSFPAVVDETSGILAWRSSTDFSVNSLALKEGYFLADMGSALTGEGRLGGFAPVRTASLDVSLKILSGHVPLAFFPFLISGPLTPDEETGYRQNRNIVLVPPGGGRVVPRMSFLENPVFPAEVAPLLKKALKIFSPGDLTLGQLRAALGLEMINEPVPDAVYLIHNDSGLGGVFVQGDLDEMILAIDAGDQVISFRQAESLWILRFCPARFTTSFVTPAETLTFDRVPLGIVMVNGRVASLGGGIIDGSGRAELVMDEGIASILRGVSLTIVSADQITLSSHLTQQGVRWLDGIPYLRDSTSQLVLYAHGRDFLDGAQKAGDILVGAGASGDLKIQANLAASDEIRLTGANRTLTVSGGVQATKVDPGANVLRIAPEERLLAGVISPPESPATAYPLIAILSLKPVQWNER